MHIDSLIYFYKVAKNGNISSVAKVLATKGKNNLSNLMLNISSTEEI